ncbi:hypothetical protein L7F22_039687 [Adiantum nelumboides]|nr:hypothetical protein [Adiantum nelumboides]MCO5562151.1 hypothetical protein [Adiantum nelumboides]MCO5585751.1 hypothetical protein [Adiantum nelumboides]
MSPFKNCMLSSQQILYKSLYLNPLSEPAELPEASSSVCSEATTSSTTSASSSSAFSSRSFKDQADSSSNAAMDRLQKENDPPREKLGQSLAKEGMRPGKEKQHVHSRRREPLRPVGGLVPKRDLKGQTRAVRLQVDEHCDFDKDGEETAPLFLPPTPTFLSHMWDDSETEVAPASAWSTLGNRTLLCRPLPLDVGCCVCYVKRERHNGVHGYVLYTDEGHGRQDRKLALAVHKRPAGRSKFLVYTAVDSSAKSEIVLGKVQANLLGSRFSICDSLDPTKAGSNGSPNLLGVVNFEPTVSSLTGTYRVMRVFIPKYQSTQITPFIHREKFGLAPDWEEHPFNVHTLYSRKPEYNKVTRCYELDFRDRTKRSSKIKPSAKNMLLTMNENGKQAILIFGKVGKSKYLLEYRFPLTAYQAFSICLSSLDSKLCCTI